MDSWEQFDETSLPDKKAFYSSLNIEDITNVDHRNAKEYSKTLIIKIQVIIIICIFRLIHYCLQIYLKILETCVLKCMS